MPDHRIELQHLQFKFNELFKRRKKSAFFHITLKTLKEIEENEIAKNPFQLNDLKQKVHISSEHTSFHLLISIYLFVNDSSKVSEILEYHRKKFEHNKLIKEAFFQKYLSTYVLETLKTTGKALRIKNFKQIELRFNEFSQKPYSENFKPIDFDFKDKWPDVKKALHLFVAEEDRNFLKLFFESGVLEERVRFKVQANLLADLFLRFFQHGIVDKKTSKSDIAQWLHNRTFVLARNKNSFVVPREDHLSNILLKRKQVNLSNRILLNLFP